MVDAWCVVIGCCRRRRTCDVSETFYDAMTSVECELSPVKRCGHTDALMRHTPVSDESSQKTSTPKDTKSHRPGDASKPTIAQTFKLTPQRKPFAVSSTSAFNRLPNKDYYCLTTASPCASSNATTDDDQSLADLSHFSPVSQSSPKKESGSQSGSSRPKPRKVKLELQQPHKLGSAHAKSPRKSRLPQPRSTKEHDANDDVADQQSTTTASVNDTCGDTTTAALAHTSSKSSPSTATNDLSSTRAAVTDKPKLSQLVNHHAAKPNIKPKPSPPPRPLGLLKPSQINSPPPPPV